MANPQYIYTMVGVGKVVPPSRQILKDIYLSFFPDAKIGILGSNGFEAALASVAENLQAQLPAELRNHFGSDEAQTNARRATLAREGADEVLARLQSGSGSGNETT